MILYNMIYLHLYLYIYIYTYTYIIYIHFYLSFLLIPTYFLYKDSRHFDSKIRVVRLQAWIRVSSTSFVGRRATWIASSGDSAR